MSYAGNLENLKQWEQDPRYQFVKGDIADKELVSHLVGKVDIIVHFAAESHVDRSIVHAEDFVQTNVISTFAMLKAARLLAISTRPHPDHCEGLAAFAELEAKTTMHVEAESFLKEFSRHWEQLTGKTLPEVSVDFYLRQGELRLGEEVFQIIETPGHAPGSICLYWEGPKVLFSGDVIFAQDGTHRFPRRRSTASGTQYPTVDGFGRGASAPGHGPGISGRGAVKENFYRVLAMFQQMF